MTRHTGSATVRERIGHPVVDGDGHTIEFLPVFEDYLREVGGRELTERFIGGGKTGDVSEYQNDWYKATPEERRDKRIYRPAFWVPTANTADRAATMLPDLRLKRMDEIGIDFSIIYTTMGLVVHREPVEEMRRALCRALNAMNADLYREHGARMTPAAVIPVHTPQEAIEELEYAVKELGYKVAMVGSHVRRPVPAVARLGPEVAGHVPWMDTLGIDSDYDYDPFWAKCMELKVAATAHSGSMGWSSRRSISRYMYNHIGHFAQANEAFCKALFFGGVTRRFPKLNFAFLEGGVAWAAGLYADLVGHWEKRNIKVVEWLDPSRMDRELLRKLFSQYGGKILKGREERLEAMLDHLMSDHEDWETLDEWAACGIEKKEDIHDLFVPNFYFGCEADDPMTAMAYNGVAGARLNAIFSSDVGHWDVPDIGEVMNEAYEMVERELLNAEDFRDFTFANSVRLHGGMNPDFFKGTVIEQEAAQVLHTTAN